MEKENPKTIVFIGDSITDCGRILDRDGLGRGFVYMVAGMLGENVHVINRGHNGFTAFQVEERLQADCLRFYPDEVSLLVGINDVCAYLGGAGGYGPEEYRRYLRQIIRRCRENGTGQITVMEPFLFPWPAEYLTWMEVLAEFQQAARCASEMENARFVPLSDVFQKAEKEFSLEQLTTDGIHLTKLGHSILAKAWFT